MTNRSILKHLSELPEASIDYPFGPEVSVYRVGNKMFGLYIIDQGVAQLNLKCEPNEALMLRDIFPAVTPGYHMNKKHWNTVILDGSIREAEITRMIDNSYLLVVKGLPTRQREALKLRNADAKIFSTEF